MAFYRPDPAMAARLESALDALDAEGRPGLRNSVSVTWVHYSDAAPEAGQGIGAAWNPNKVLYPARVVKRLPPSACTGSGLSPSPAAAVVPYRTRSATWSANFSSSIAPILMNGANDSQISA